MIKRQATHLEKIFTNHVSDKGLVHRLYKELSKLNREKNNPIYNTIQRIKSSGIYNQGGKSLVQENYKMFLKGKKHK